MALEIKSNLSLIERKNIAGIFTKNYYQAYFNGITYISHLILKIFRNLGILELLEASYITTDEIIREFNFAPETKYALDWILLFLSQNGFLEKSGYKYHYLKIKVTDLDILTQETLKIDPGILPSAKLMEYVVNEYPNFFKGIKKGFEILFANEKMALWNNYFSNENSGYSVHNSLGALGVLKWAFKKDSIRFLEVGGGTGSASSTLIDDLKNKNMLSRISEYIFSDISPVFLRIGNRAIMGRVGDSFNYTLKRLDFNKPIIQQGIEEDGVDVVYGVNTLHVAKNLVESLKNIYRVIKPGGVLILSECLRPNINYLLCQEIIFNLLDDYVNVELDNYLRPIPGFLDYQYWKRNLEAAGFRDIEAIFNTDTEFPQGLEDKINVLATVIKAEKGEG